MEISQYLTAELKEYYLLDFQKLLSYSGSPFWDLDEGLKQTLQSINSNSHIQTLYSKKFAFSNESISLEYVSYLEIAFAKTIESKLLELLIKIKDLLTKKGAIISIQILTPSSNANYNPDSKIQLGCIINPSYFMINHIRIEIESNDIKHHDLFWNELDSKLSGLTE